MTLSFQSITLAIQHTCNIKSAKTSIIPYSLFYRQDPREIRFYWNKDKVLTLKEAEGDFRCDNFFNIVNTSTGMLNC